MIDEAEVFSMTTTTTCANGGITADWLADVVVVAVDGTALITAAQQSTTQNRARRAVFIAAFVCALQRGFDDEGVNFLVAAV